MHGRTIGSQNIKTPTGESDKTVERTLLEVTLQSGVKRSMGVTISVSHGKIVQKSTTTRNRPGVEVLSFADNVALVAIAK